MRLSKLLTRTLGALGCLALAAGVYVTRSEAFDRHQAAEAYEDVYYLPGAAVLPVLSLGYRQALADILWCRTLVYFGEELLQRSEIKYVFEYTDAILALDPDFRAAYPWIAMAAIYRPADVSVETGLRAAEYMKRAVDRWPDDGDLQWEYGSLLRFELAPLVTDPVQKRALLERAAPHLETAASLGAGPSWLAINSVDLLNKLGRTEQAIRHMQEMHAIVPDGPVKEELAQRLGALRAHAFVEEMRAAGDAFEKARTRDYPYLTPGLFLILGERPRTDTVDVLSVLADTDDQRDERGTDTDDGAFVLP